MSELQEIADKVFKILDCKDFYILDPYKDSLPNVLLQIKANTHTTLVEVHDRGYTGTYKTAQPMIWNSNFLLYKILHSGEFLDYGICHFGMTEYWKLLTKKNNSVSIHINTDFKNIF